MPPKVKVTRDEIIKTAFIIIRESGLEQLNVRQIAHKLNCSTQPVMYHFQTVTNILRKVYAKADQFHTEYLITTHNQNLHPMLQIGLNYIRFAKEEAPLFRFLFQSSFSPHKNLLEMIDSPELTPILLSFQKSTNLKLAQIKTAFITLALFAHGYASLLSNHQLEYNETLILSHLTQTYKGALLTAQKDIQ